MGPRYASVVLEDKPLFYLRLGESAGAPVARDSGPSQRGIFGTSGTVRFGQPGALARDADGAVYFTGAGTPGSWLNVGDIDVAGSAITLEAWAKAPSANAVGGQLNGYGHLIDKHQDATDNNGWLRIKGYNGSTGGQLEFSTTHGGAFTNLSSTALPMRRQLEWNHYVGVYDGAKMYIYINGQLDTSTAATGNLANNNWPWAVGASKGNLAGTADGWVGWIDEAAVYPSALSAARIALHYRVGVTGPGRPRDRITLIPPSQIRITPPAASVTFSAAAPQLAPRNKINAPAATVTFSAPAPQVQRLRIVAPAASVTFNAPAPTVKEKVRPPAALVTFSAARPAAFQGATKIQVTPAALLVFSAPAPTISTSAPGIGALPSVSFTPGTSWAFVICDRFGKPISLISRLARNKQLVFNLNRPTELSFTVPGDDPRVNRIHDGDNLPVLEPGARTVKAYRKEGNRWMLRFAGFLWDRNPAERDASSSVVDIAVTCYDPMQRLVARLCRGSAGGFASTITFFTTPGSEIAKALVDRTILYGDAFANDLGIETTGTFQTTSYQTVSYDQQFVAPALIQLCDTQTMDVIFQPVDRQNGILAVMGVVAQRGHDRPAVVFGYDAFPHSAVGWNSSKSMDDFADDLTLFSGKKQFKTHRVDGGAKYVYGTYEDAQVLNDITDETFLNAIADTEILLRKRPRELVGFTPIPEKSAAPFLDWFLGDTVYTEASANTGAAISGLQRIYGFTLDISDAGFEIVSELRVSAAAE